MNQLIRHVVIQDTTQSETVDSDTFEQRNWLRRMCCDRHVPNELCDRLWTNADELVHSGRMLKPGDRCTVVRIDLKSSSWVLKRYNRKGLWHTALHWLLTSRAENCWHFGRYLNAVGIPSPRPVAFLEHRFGPLRMGSYLLTEYVPGELLTEYVEDQQDVRNHLTDVAARFGEFWRRFTQRRLSHGDMKATNFLVTDGPKIWVIDLDAVRRHRIHFLGQHAQSKDKKRFLKNWDAMPRIQTQFQSAIDD